MTDIVLFSIVIPAYNEAGAIGHVVHRVKDVLKPTGHSFEILVIDDGSSDGSAKAAADAGAQVIRHPYNKGNGAAIKTGIRAAKGNIIIFMDGDGQHDPQDILRLARSIIEDGYDMVVGARTRDSQASWYRGIANRIYNEFATYLTDFPVEDLTSGFRAIRRKLALQFCYLLPNTFSYPSTITISIIKAGYSLKYEPIQAAQRTGKSKIKIFRDGLRFLLIITKISMLFSPLKIFLPAGTLIFLPGFLYAIYKLLIGKPWTIPIVILLSIGTLIVMMGFLAEQVSLLRFQHIDSMVDTKQKDGILKE